MIDGYRTQQDLLEERCVCDAIDQAIADGAKPSDATCWACQELQRLAEADEFIVPGPELEATRARKARERYRATGARP